MEILFRRQSIVLFFLVIWFSKSQGSIGIVENTWRSVPDEFKQYSLTNGAIAWYTGLLNNFHRFANFFPVITKDHRDRTVIGYDPIKTNNMYKLVYILFYRVPGSLSYTDFDVTKHLKIDDPIKIAELMAYILTGLDKLEQLAEQLALRKQELESNIQKARVLAEVSMGESELGESKSKLKQILNLKEALTNSINKFEKENRITILEHTLNSLKDPSLNDIKNSFIEIRSTYNSINATWLNYVTKLLKLNKTSFLKVAPLEFFEIVLGAFSEIKAGLYPADFVSMIFLGFFYKTALNMSKNDEGLMRATLSAYYEFLQRIIKKEITFKVDNSLPDNSLPLIISPSVAIQKCKGFINDPKAINKELDSFLYYVIKSRPFPPLTTYATVTYAPFDSTESSFEFTDCVENSIANFIRTLAYDIKSGLYSAQILSQRLKIKVESPYIDLLLDNNFDHNRWATFLANIPHVAYLQSGEAGKKPLENPKDSKGFIKLDEKSLSMEKAYGDAGFLVITDKNTVCFELLPSIRTLILIFDYIFQLKLIESQEDILRDDFVSIYFPKLCKKLNLQGALGIDYKDKIDDDSDDDFNFDQLDQQVGTQLIASFFIEIADLGGAELKNYFATDRKHCEYTFSMRQERPDRQINIMQYNQAIKTYQLSNSIFPLLAYYLESPLVVDLDTAEQYRSFFALPLYNSDFNAVIFSKKMESLWPKHPNMELLLLSLAKNQPSPQLLWRDMNFLLKSKSFLITNKLFSEMRANLLVLLKRESTREEALSMLARMLKKEKLATGILSEDFAITQAILDLFSTQQDFEDEEYDDIATILNELIFNQNQQQLVQNYLGQAIKQNPLVRQAFSKFLLYVLKNDQWDLPQKFMFFVKFLFSSQFAPQFQEEKDFVNLLRQRLDK